METVFSTTFRKDDVAVAAMSVAVEIVAGLSRVWQPDFFSVTNGQLRDLEIKRLQQSKVSLPSWGYVSWLSDAVSRDLEFVEGARATRFGDRCRCSRFY